MNPAFPEVKHDAIFINIQFAVSFKKKILLSVYFLQLRFKIDTKN